MRGGINSQSGPFQSYVARLNTDGSLDASFGTNGITYLDIASSDNDSFGSVLLQPDGRIVATGDAGYSFTIARFLPGGSILVSPRSGTTTEAGGQTQFDVVLASAPTSTVTISLAQSVLGEGTLSTSNLTFTPANALTPQTVTVFGTDDLYDDGDLVYLIRVGNATSADADFNSARGADFAVTNIDDDTAGIIVTPTAGLVTYESGGDATFTVRLNCLPRNNVTITLSSSSSRDGSTTPTSLTFTPTNGLIERTVTVNGLDDLYDDDNVMFNIVTAPAVSSDSAYSGLNAPDVSVTNVDNDTAGIVVEPISGLVTTEAGGTATFNIRLLTIPFFNVQIGLSSSDTTEGTVPASVTFSANITALDPHPVTVTGRDDTIIDGTIPYTIVTTAATSGDSKYAGTNPPDVAASNLDNDAAGFVVTPVTGLVTTESGGTATFTLRLTATPNANVTIALNSSNTNEGTISSNQLTFTPGNGLTPQTVTVTGVNDGIIDGPINYTIVTGAAASTDFEFNALNPPDVSATNLDNDPITVVSVVVSNGAVQRSMVKGITITFGQVVVLGNDAFTVRRSDGVFAGLVVTPTVVNGRTVVTLTFSGGDVVAGSLADGNYVLTIAGSQVTDQFGQQLDGNGDGTPGGDYQLSFFRFFGDTNGDRHVDIQDFALFSSTYNLSVGQVGFISYLDYNGDGHIDIADFGQFSARFFGILP